MASGVLDIVNGQPKQVGTGTSNRAPSTIYATNLDASTSIVVGSTGLRSDRVRHAGQSSNPSDPALAAGDVWFRSDTGKLMYYDGAAARQIVDTSTSGIPDPGTKAANDLLQYTGSAWDAKGAASGDRLTGPIYMSSMDISGTLNFAGASGQHITWSTDGGGNIGSAGALRPDNIYAKTGIYQGSNQVLDTSIGGTKNTNDILQLTSGGSWDAVGGTDSDPVLGILFTSSIYPANVYAYLGSDTYPWGLINTKYLQMIGNTNTNMVWLTDGAGNVGTNSGQRPDYVYARSGVKAGPVGAGTSVYMQTDRINWAGASSDVSSPVAGDMWYRTDLSGFRFRDGSGTTRDILHSGTSFAGDVTGAYNSTSVTKIQGDAVSTTDPTSNQGLVWTGSEYAPRSLSWFPVASQSVNATSVTVDSLAGNTHYAYEILLHGNWAASGSQKYIYLVPRTSGGDQTGSQYSHRHVAGVEPGIGSVHTVTSIGSRLVLHMNDWSHSQDVFIHAVFFAATGTYNRRMISHTVQEEAGKSGAGEQGKFLEGMYHGVWRDTTNAITGLKIDFNGATFVGRLQINALRIA